MKNININKLDREVSMALESFSLKKNYGRNGDDVYRIYSEYQYFYDTPYFYKQDKLLHFTSLNSLFEILNSNSLRMYSLYNCNDKLELEYWKSIFKEEDYDFYKEHHILSMSFTKPDKYNDLLMWRLYGDNGNGVCIELEIDNDRREWKNFILAPVNYSLVEQLTSQYYDKISKLKEECNINLNIDLSPIIPFFKSKNWEHEQEVRMIYYKSDQIEDFKITRLQSIKNHKIVNYIPFPINHVSKHKEFNLIDETIPKLRISKIYVGFHKADERFELLRKILDKYCSNISNEVKFHIDLESLEMKNKIC